MNHSRRQCRVVRLAELRPVQFLVPATHREQLKVLATFDHAAVFDYQNEIGGSYG